MAGTKQSLHYNSICNDYDDLYSYRKQVEPQFIQDILSAISRNDFPHEDTVLADIGCGTGMLLKSLAEQQRFREFFAVDPNGPMLDLVQTAGDTPVRKFKMDGENFFKLDGATFDVSILYSMIHHIPEKVLPDFLQGIYNQTNPGGTLLIISVGDSLNCPVWRNQHECFKNRFPTWRNLTELVKEAGFDDVTCQKKSYGDVVIPRDQYLWMLRNRFISTLSTATDDEIEEGIKLMDYPDPVVFEGLQYFIKGTKTGDNC